MVVGHKVPDYLTHDKDSFHLGKCDREGKGVDQG
jgi:hypothetical protein